ncbi:MAG: Na(+)-translocating NADH-quinone reductase subunit C [Candidatus Hydrogenedentota bacterium]|nr:MAG: Na(+)-translocating NADH-quinone reductase subunit C [Candidatus Hydrogenedentota bacterium]
MQRNSVGYIIGFAAAVCIVCSVLVSATATLLKDRQIMNQRMDKQMKVLSVSGLVEPGVKPSMEEIEAFFSDRIDVLIINMKTGEVDTESDLDSSTYDPIKAAKNPASSHKVDKNLSKVSRVPDRIPVYVIKDEEGNPNLYVLPVEGMGLWGFLYGFLALDTDIRTIQGLTFYKHKETPGLGAEVDNPNWKAKWPGRLAFDEEWVPRIGVIKGPAGSVDEAPYAVDGLSGSTLTSNGVTNLLRFWLGDNGFGPYLSNLRGEGS